MVLVNDIDRQRISTAISAAESKTSGEIVAVVAPSSDTYAYAPLMWAALVALFVPWPLIHFTWWPVQWIFLIQLAVFLIALAAMWPKSVRVCLVPKSVRDSHVERRASDQFLAQNLHTTSGRTGVLIFVSALERRAVICADTAIDSVVAPGVWQTIVDRLTDAIGNDQPTEGFIRAIDDIGALLAQHFPPGSPDDNALPDHLIVLPE